MAGSDIGPTSENTGRPRVKDLALREWTWRTGKEAATHRLAFYSWINRAWVASLVGFLFILVGGFDHIPALIVLGIATLCVWLSLNIRAWIELSRMRKSISKTLGIPINVWSNPPPPRDVDKYRLWCIKNGLTPYPFKPGDE